MYQERLRTTYASEAEWLRYSETYGLAERLGKDAHTLWIENPLLQGSTNPDDFCIIREKRSLIGAKFGNDLWELLSKPDHCYPKLCAAHISGDKRGRYKSIAFMARHCWRWYHPNIMPRRDKELTGGLLLVCRVDQYTRYQHWMKEVRLKPNWTRKQFDAAVQRLTDAAIVEVERQRVVCKLDDACKPYHDDKAWLKAVTAREKRVGNSDLSTMTIEAAAGWRKWLDNWAARH